MKKLYKIENGKIISGVCGGLAEYFGIDPSIVRLVCVLICLCKGIGILIYIAAAIILPTKSEVLRENNIYEGQANIHQE